MEGEESIVEDYDAAIAEASGDAATRDMLVGRRDAPNRQVEKVKAMRPAWKAVLGKLDLCRYGDLLTRS